MLRFRLGVFLGMREDFLEEFGELDGHGCGIYGGETW